MEGLSELETNKAKKEKLKNKGNLIKGMTPSSN
jgi:hypothetical protein